MTLSNTSANTLYTNNIEQAAGLAGDLLRIGRGKTPFLDKIGGLGTNAKMAKDWRFILNNQYALESPGQKSITEAAAAAAPPTTLTYDRDQDYNVCQIFQYGINVSYAAQSATSYLDGLPLAGAQQMPVDPLTFQLRATMEQMALDIDWAFLNGTYAGTFNGAAIQTRGLKEAITTNKINADSGYTTDELSTKMIDDAMIALADTSKAPMQDMWVLCTAGAKQKLSQLYGNTPFTAPSTTVGGQAIETINTDFGPLKLMYEPQMSTGYMFIVDMADISPVFLPVPGKGAVFYEQLAKTGAAEVGQLYAQVGLGYVAEEHHAQVYGFDLV
jgi:hypothetical protein